MFGMSIKWIVNCLINCIQSVVSIYSAMTIISSDLHQTTSPNNTYSKGKRDIMMYLLEKIRMWNFRIERFTFEV